MTKIEELEAKVMQVIDKVAALQQENAHLKSECESLKSHLALVSGENGKAQHFLADYDKLRRTRDQVIHRVERALHTLNALRSA